MLFQGVFPNIFQVKQLLDKNLLLKHQIGPGSMIVRGVSSCDNEAIKQKHKTKHREELKMKKVNKTSSKKGFSLVELICVIAIIVILASVLCFNYYHVFKHAIEALEMAFA